MNKALIKPQVMNEANNIEALLDPVFSGVTPIDVDIHRQRLAALKPGDHKETKVLYLLQITKEKLNHDFFFLLKCMLLHAHRSTDTEILVIECYFDENDFDPIEDHIETVQMIFFNGYNLLEPERS
jgi:hypothetical protein